MTRKQAISQAIEILSQESKNVQIVEKLCEISAELPLSAWTQEAILDAIENYALEHDNILPYERELTAENHMPSNTVIYNKFGLKSIRKFYAEYFPTFNTKALHVSPYDNLTEEDFKNFFIQNYYRIKEKLAVKTVSNRLYNAHKADRTPCPETIMRNCNCETYNELLILCGIKKKNKPLETHMTITYNDEDRWHEDLDSLLKSKRE